MDGSGRPSGCRTATPGHWDPVAPNGHDGATTRLRGPAGVKPFLMQSSSQFRSAGPLALKSAAYAAEFNEVKALGGDGARRRPHRTEQTYIAKWWQSNPVASWNDVARQLIARNHLDAADSARLLAMQNLAAADAAINSWNDKYHYDFWRPLERDPQGGETDGNADDVARRDAGRRCSRRPTPITRRDTSASTVRTPPCCGCSSATHRAGGYQITSAS